MLEQFARLLLDLTHGFAYFFEQINWGRILRQSIILLHNVCDALHDTIKFESDADCLGDIVSVLDAHADQLCDLHEFFLVRVVDHCVFALLVDELDDAIGLILGLTWRGLSVDWPDHEVSHVAHFGLVIDLIDKPWLLFGVIDDDNVAVDEDLPAQADICREVDKLHGLLLVQFFHALLSGLWFLTFLLSCLLFLLLLRNLSRYVWFDQLLRCGHDHGFSCVMTKTCIIIIVRQMVR